MSRHPCLPIPREQRFHQTDNCLYLISTTHNYHVFDDIHKDVDTNLTVLLDTLKNLRPGGGGVFNFISSWFVYGETTLPASENTPCHPKGFYSITKLAAEQLLASYCQTFGISYRILRLCNVYGPGDPGASPKKNALHYLIGEMRHHRDIPLYHGGLFYRDYLHVDDVARAIDWCIHKAPLDCVINVGSGEKLLFLDLMTFARDCLGSRSAFVRVSPPDFHRSVQVKDFIMDITVLKNLGFSPSITIQDGIKHLCQI
ncbi:MAG: NAD-dependent epimerase/dehydratase family protein [Nitrospirae bacterium]|nr:NAD-dependent epimerase/dehydratase family protein [Magnetococcales bacterium]